MPWDTKDLWEAIGQMTVNFWATQKVLEETQEENKQLKEKLDLLLNKPETSEVISTE